MGNMSKIQKTLVRNEILIILIFSSFAIQLQLQSMGYKIVQFLKYDCIALERRRREREREREGVKFFVGFIVKSKVQDKQVSNYIIHVATKCREVSNSTSQSLI